MVALMDFAETWAPLALTITWQLAALAALVWVCEGVLRLRQARVRHALWWCVLLAPLLLAPGRLALERYNRLVPVPAPAPVVRAAAVARAAAVTHPFESSPALRRVPARPEALPSPESTRAAASRAAPSRTSPPSVKLSWSALLMCVWLLGCGVIAARLMLGHRRLRRMISESQPVGDPAAVDTLDALRREAGVRRPVAMRATRAVSAPLLYGLRRPVILMPEEWLDSLSPDDLQAVLAHEVAHVKRGDFLGNLLQRLAELPLFFHPAAWLAGRRIALAREELCDAAALAPGADPRTYALSLLAAAERTRARLAMASVGVAEGKFTLLRRVEAIMRTGGMKRINRSVATGLALVVVAAAAALGIAEFRDPMDRHRKDAEPKVLFAACTPGHPAGPGLFIADSDLSNPIRLTTPVPELPNAEDYSPGSASGCDIGAWYLDGTRIVVSRNMYLYTLDLRALIEHPRQEPVPLRNEAGDMISAGNPCWSPDGTRIAFNGGGDMGIVNADGTGYRLLTEGGFTAREVTWSPDGAAIAFRWGMEEAAHLYLVTNIDGPGDPELGQLTDDPEWRECWPQWSPDGSMLAFTRTPPGETTQAGDIWVMDVATREEWPLIETPDLRERVLGWSPFDGKLYYSEWGEGPNSEEWLVRMDVDGSGVERFQRAVMPASRLTWAMAGAWIEGVNALPGERVVAKLGVQDTEGLVEAAADISYVGGSNTIELTDVRKGSSIENWVMRQPQVGDGVLSVEAYARDPDSQSVSGPAHLFDLGFENTPRAVADDIQVLDFESLHLGDQWGGEVEGPALAGGVRTVPFAALDLSIGSKRVYGDGNVALWVNVRALDRKGKVMTGCDNPICLGTFLFEPDKYWVKANEITPARPATVTLRRGVWSGRVIAIAPDPGAPLIAYWGDIAARSDPLIPPREGATSLDTGEATPVAGATAAPIAWLPEPTRTEAITVHSNMKQLALAMLMWLADNDQVLPSSNDTAEVRQLLHHYVKSESVFMRPGTEEVAVRFQFEPGAAMASVEAPHLSEMAVVDYHPDFRVTAYLDGHAALEPGVSAETQRAQGGGGRTTGSLTYPREVQRLRSNMQRLGLAMRRYLEDHGGVFPRGRDADDLLKVLRPYLTADQLLLHPATGEALTFSDLHLPRKAVARPEDKETAFVAVESDSAPGVRVHAYVDGHVEIEGVGRSSGGGGWGLAGVVSNVEQLALAMSDYLADHKGEIPEAADIRTALDALEPYLRPKLLFVRPGKRQEVVRYVMQPGTRWSDIPAREAHTTPVFVADFGYEYRLVVAADMAARIEAKGGPSATPPRGSS